MVYNLHAVTEDLTITKGSLNDLTEVVQFHSALTNFTLRAVVKILVWLIFSVGSLLWGATPFFPLNVTRLLSFPFAFD